MTTELNISFTGTNQYSVRFDNCETKILTFNPPVTAGDMQDIRWYLETYAASYTSEPDDDRAAKIEANLPVWGEALFKSVFTDMTAANCFFQFFNLRAEGRLLTVSAEHPSVLSLPWELLGIQRKFLFNENPRISVRRRLSGAGGIGIPYSPAAKDRLHLLFVVSRPNDAGFIDPRSDTMAVMDALEAEAPGRVDVEFLRPATLDNLVKRLERKGIHKGKPKADILHFDGHGVFDPDGRMKDRALAADTFAVLRGDAGKPMANTGYLLFEDADGKSAMITAETLGQMLNAQDVGLAVLSACQSAALGEEEAMGSVAARLTHAGVPSVLAMTHSVLVTTTRALFGAFYENLASGQGVGASLDDARRHLYMNPQRGERRRGERDWITLNVQDWFLPALYQQGADMPMLTKQSSGISPSEKAIGNLPEFKGAGFFGRTRELWEIETAFVRGTRRLTVSGFGGQGKTFLAVEAGHWLVRTGMFQKACFVGYADFQGVDPEGVAVSTLATVLNQSLLDANAAADALRKTPTLVILDNLENLSPEGQTALLNAAKSWSEAGDSRVLLTTRQADFRHPDYGFAGTWDHVLMNLKGLHENDAVAFFQAKMKLPPLPKTPSPERHALVELFKMVDFHPLSIGLLAEQLKELRPADLGETLAELLKQTPTDDPNRSLIASLNLSLQRLDEDARKWLPRLGVFQGGAMEDVLLKITDITTWSSLRRALENTGLIRVEPIPGHPSPFLKFHPTLAPALWARLTQEEKQTLSARHTQQYYRLSGWLYFEDKRNIHVVRAIAIRELPNLLHGVHSALGAGDEDAVEFANNVNKFLNVFSLTRDREALTQKAQKLTQPGSRAWYLARSNHGEQLHSAGRYSEAEGVFKEILQGLGEKPSYERCATLDLLGRCYRLQGNSRQAAETYRQVLILLDELEQTEGVKRERGVVQGDLADTLRDLGDYAGARVAYEAALVIAKEQNDGRQIGAVEGQLGTLAMLQGNLNEAVQRYREALSIFRKINEPASEAVIWNQLGMAFRRAEKWEESEEAYRESAKLEENRGNLAGAAQTWNNLALVIQSAGKPDQAEAWYRKAIEGGRKVGDRVGLSKRLSNLADLLQNTPARLDEARQLAEESLKIKKTIDPGAAEIWNTYSILAEIAGKQKQPEQAREYRRLAREARAGFMGTQHELQRHSDLIVAVVAAVQENQQAIEFVKQYQAAMRQGGPDWSRLADTIDRILAGERDLSMIENQGDLQSIVLETILQGIENPESLKELM